MYILQVDTSELLQYRTRVCVPKRICDLRKAIDTQDWMKCAELIMKDSNQFHAICMDTFPPLNVSLLFYKYFVIFITFCAVLNRLITPYYSCYSQI
jgi:hypothetical protein